MQFYRENAKWRERTCDFVARIGIERIRAVIVEDCEGLGAALDAAQASVDATSLIPGRKQRLLRPQTNSPRLSRRRRGEMARQAVIGRVNQIPKGEGRTFEVNGLHIAVYHTDSGEVFATQPNCPHRGGPLADGLVGGTTVICPLHDRSFDLRTGKNLSRDCADVRTYPVILRDDGGIVLSVEPEGRSEAVT
jgi:nitrite reductase (NADH) small subunit